MNKQICDICQNAVKITENTENHANAIVDLEFYDNIIDGRYAWARVGIINVDLCPEHRSEAMKNLVKRIIEKYSLKI